ncbi:hypothetical protein [Metallosphaera hakonensis]|uniref:hypothetical protein n=1 Tax=Metallosphaera hakonensis TaxID=79601 RepID=UPI0020931675|nr:hypothetical protein [Metallosphaera hakonensis]
MFLEDELGLKHGEKVGLDERLLAIEQLPQIAKILNLSLSWKQSLNLHGPDGTEVTVEGEGEKLEAVTPILEGSIPWTFPRISPEHLRAMIRDLIPCNEAPVISIRHRGRERSLARE